MANRTHLPLGDPVFIADVRFDGGQPVIRDENVIESPSLRGVVS
jgi:hypothetical protein